MSPVLGDLFRSAYQENSFDMCAKLCKDVPSVKMRRNQQDMSWNQLNQFRREEQFCDITIQCSDGQVGAHKCVLASVSEYFKVMFTTPLSFGSSCTTADFNDFSVEVVTLLLDVVYSEADIPAVHVVELLRLADYVQLQWLVDVLIEHVRKDINETNIYDWYAAAKGCGISKLVFLCECFVRENIKKLDWENVKSCFGLNNLEEMSALKGDLKREIVLLSTGYSERKLHIIDPAFERSKILTNNAQHRELSKFLEERYSYETFLYGNVLYFVSYAIINEAPNGDRYVYNLWKFQQLTKSFLQLAEWRESDVKKRLVNGEMMTASGLCLKRSLHDGLGNLYILFSNHCRAGFRMYLLKFDLCNMVFHDGYVASDLDHCQTDLAYLKDHGICLITPSAVYKLEQHDFKVMDYKAEALEQVDLSTQVLAKNGGDEIEEFSTTDIEWDGWKTVNFNGCFYCLVDIDFPKEEYELNVVLKLDIGTQCWTLCAEWQRQYGGCISRRLFHCASRIFLHWTEEDDEDEDEVEMQTTYYYLDEEKGRMKHFDLTFETMGHSINYYAVIPYHFLL